MHTLTIQKSTHRFTFLFVILLLLLVTTPVIQNEGTMLNVLYQSGFTAILLAAWWAVRDDESESRTTLGLAIPAFVAGWLTVAVPSLTLRVVATLFLMAFLTLVTIELVRFAARSRRVTSDTIYAALSAYLLIGLVFASLYTICDLFQPESLGLMDNPIGGGDRMGAAIYFSFVTLTTLGYGDISPASGWAAGLAPAEAILGQAYMAVLVARLVGLYTAQGMSEDVEEDIATDMDQEMDADPGNGPEKHPNHD